MKKLRIYLDNCCFNRPFDSTIDIKIKLEAEAKLYIQFLIINGQMELIWSYMLEHENSQNPFDDRQNSISRWRSFCTTTVLETEATILRAENYRELGFKTKDAIHLSCAVEAGCDYFVTTDNKIINKKLLIREIDIINPLEIFAILGGDADDNKK